MEKLCKYTICVHDTDDALLLYNTLNGALLRFTSPAQKQVITALMGSGTLPDSSDPALHEALSKRQILLPASVDEAELARYRFLEAYAQSRVLSFLVYVTEACNFRCRYCPESHDPLSMSAKTADQFCELVETALSTGRYSALSVGWFGGEPLLNFPVIRRTMKRLRAFCEEHGLSLSAGATTNGYLLTEDTVSELLALGVTQFQITVDGMAETHDRLRPLVDGTGTWRIIWDNLRAMAKRSEAFSVTLRVNANRSSLASVKKWLLLADENLDIRFHLIVQPISNMGGDASCEEYCDLEEGQRIQLALSDYLDEQTDHGIGRVAAQLAPLGLLCNSARPNYYIVRTDGGIAKCELNIQSEAAVLSQPGKTQLKEELLAQYLTPAVGPCEECKLYPLCFGLVCPHKKIIGIPCTYSEHFLLDENIRLLARHFRRKDARKRKTE